MRKILTALTALLTFLFAPALAFANHGDVLGTRTESSRVDLSVNQGPGFLLPTSPIYFVDLLRDNIGLLLSSYSVEGKAKLHLQLAGERISEINMMIDTKEITPRALDIALANISENTEGAVQTLKLAKNKGKNVEQLAGDLNVLINAEKASLRAIQGKSDTEGSLKIAAKLAKIREVEITVEDEMAADLLEQEVVSELKAALLEADEEAAESTRRSVLLSDELGKKVPAKISSQSGEVSGATVEN